MTMKTPMHKDGHRYGSFINDIKRGDIIALPLKTSESKFVAIGQIVGEFQNKDAESGLLHTRQVNWLKKDLLVSKLDEEMRLQLIRRPTVYSIEDDKMLNQIVKILNDGRINYFKQC